MDSQVLELLTPQTKPANAADTLATVLVVEFGVGVVPLDSATASSMQPIAAPRSANTMPWTTVNQCRPWAKRTAKQAKRMKLSVARQ